MTLYDGAWRDQEVNVLLDRTDAFKKETDSFKIEDFDAYMLLTVQNTPATFERKVLQESQTSVSHMVDIVLKLNHDWKQTQGPSIELKITDNNDATIIEIRVRP